MLNNFQLYKLLNFIVNKDVYAKAMTPDNFDVELKSKNIRYLRKRIGLPESYIPGQVNAGAGVHRLGDVDLLPFLVVSSPITPVSGVVTLPANWYYPLDFYTENSITSDLLSYDEISSRIRNFITKPTVEHPAAYMVQAGIKVLPETSTSKVTVTYYRRPVDPVFKTTINPVTLRLEYAAVGNVELEWDDGGKLDILSMILQEMGVNIERQDAQQLAAKMIATGL